MLKPVWYCGLMAEEQLSKNVHSLVNESNLHNIEDASLMFSFKS